MLRQRLLTAAILLPVFLGGLFLLPNAGWSVMTLVPITLAAGEWARLARYGRRATVIFIGIVLASGGVLALALWQAPAIALAVSAWLYLVALLFWTMAVPAWLYFKWKAGNPWLMAAAGWIVLVPAWLAVSSLQARGALLLLMLLLVVWIADTAAYFAGRRFGRRKLAPQISPGKTWEGVIGAAVAVLVYGWAMGYVLEPNASLQARAGLLVFVCILTALSIVGDLFESWIKRSAGAKDSGELLPGHGGVLDRIDSLTAAMPFAALYFVQQA